MKSCILIQCFVKELETINVLKSLELCEGIHEYSLVLYIDKAIRNSKFENANNELINKLLSYKNENISKYLEITIIVADKNLGPYICCGKGIDFCFSKYDYVIFSEDDALFMKDSIKFYNSYRDNIIPNPEDCISISAFSPFFITNNKDLEYVKTKYCNQIDLIKNDVLKDNLFNKTCKINLISNKQFGIFKNKWEKIRHFRTSYHMNLKLPYAPDRQTTNYVIENKLFSYFSIIPRTNDIGLFHELGCTTLYYKKDHELRTIKFLTSDDFFIEEKKDIEILDNVSFQHCSKYKNLDNYIDL